MRSKGTTHYRPKKGDHLSQLRDHPQDRRGKHGDEGGATMSPEKQRIAIATACGWTADSWCLTPSGWVFADAVPDYLNDLNAMHEAEEVLMEKGVNAWWSYVAFINRHNSRQFGTETAVHATAAEKCEAFLRTLGLWEEEQ